MKTVFGHFLDKKMSKSQFFSSDFGRKNFMGPLPQPIHPSTFHLDKTPHGIQSGSALELQEAHVLQTWIEIRRRRFPQGARFGVTSLPYQRPSKGALESHRQMRQFHTKTLPKQSHINHTRLIFAPFSSFLHHLAHFCTNQLIFCTI